MKPFQDMFLPNINPEILFYQIQDVLDIVRGALGDEATELGDLLYLPCYLC